MHLFTIYNFDFCSLAKLLHLLLKLAHFCDALFVSRLLFCEELLERDDLYGFFCEKLLGREGELGLFCERLLNKDDDFEDEDEYE